MILGSVRVTALAAVVLAAPASAALPAPITVYGVGGVRPGMTLAEAERRWAVDLRPDPIFGPRCVPAFFRTSNVLGYAIFSRGKFAAVFFERGATTYRGIRIGATLSELERAYPRGLTWRRDYYGMGRDYFFRRHQPRTWTIGFDVYRGRVFGLSFGLPWAVRLTEGCA